MKTHKLYFCILLILAFVLVSVSCAPAPYPSEGPPEENEAGGGPKEITLRASVIMNSPIRSSDMTRKYLSLNETGFESAEYLQAALDQAAQEISSEEIVVKVEIQEIRIAMAIFECPETMFAGAGQFDIYMLMSGTAPYAIQNTEFTNPSDYISLPAYMDPIVGSGFKDEDQVTRGLTQATMPMLLIYNPDLMLESGIELTDPLSLDEFIEITTIQPVVIPPNAAVILALSHSMFGEDLNEYTLFNINFYNRMMSFSDKMDGFFGGDGVYAMDQEEIVGSFMDQNIAWTINTAGFLLMLAEGDYNGPIGIRPIPTDSTQGGLSMATGWTVPAESEYPDLAWGVIKQVLNKSEMVRWALKNGMVPVTANEFNQVFSNPEWVGGAMPLTIFEEDPYSGLVGMDTIQRITRFSKPWQVPLIMSEEQYYRLEPVANEFVLKVANKEWTYSDAFNQARDILIEEGLFSEP